MGWANKRVEWREPYESRGSRTVRRGPWGEIPQGYSTGISILGTGFKPPTGAVVKHLAFDLVVNTRKYYNWCLQWPLCNSGEFSFAILGNSFCNIVLFDYAINRLDDKQQKVINKQATEDIVLDINKDDKIIGIEILNVSRRINLENLFPLKYKISKKAVS